MLRITIQVSPKTIRLQLEGKLAGPWVDELERSWTAAASSSGKRRLHVDLTGVSFISTPAKELLRRISAAGADLIACGCLNRAIVEEVKCKGAPHLAALLALTALWFSGTTARAQTAPLPLTLKEAVQIALRQNPQVQIANLNLAQSRQDQAIARAGLLPQTAFRVSEGIQRINLEAFIGRKFLGMPQHAGPFETFQAGPAFSASVLDLTLWNRWRASKEMVQASGAQERTVREQIVALVVSQYLGSLRSAADVTAAQARVDLAQALYDQAADLQKNGVGTGIDTLRANVELQNERQNLITAQTALQTTLFGLSRLLNIDPNRPVELADRVSFFDTPAIQVDRSLEAAYTNRPEMMALRHQQQALEYDRRASEVQRLPSVRFDGNWAYVGTAPQTVIPSYLYQMSLNFPLFTGGRIAAETARADLEMQKNAQQEREQRNVIALEVKTAIVQLEAARHQVEVANLNVNLARQEVEQARDRFQAGVANNIETVTAQEALARANDNQIVALYRYNQARADLARSTGQIENIYK
jgi:outer membrane protein TolC